MVIFWFHSTELSQSTMPLHMCRILHNDLSFLFMCHVNVQKYSHSLHYGQFHGAYTSNSYMDKRNGKVGFWFQMRKFQLMITSPELTIS